MDSKQKESTRKRRSFPKSDLNGSGDALESPVKKKIPKSTPCTPVKASPIKQKSKFTLKRGQDILALGVSRIPTLERAISLDNFNPDILTPSTPYPSPIKPLPEVRTELFKKPKPVPAFKVHRVTKPVRKSATMLELRVTPKKNEPNFAEKFNEFQLSDNGTGNNDDRYRYLAYKTFAFMLKNGLNRVKRERDGLLETVKKSKTALTRSKTQLHVLNSLYRVERNLLEKSHTENKGLKTVIQGKENIISDFRLQLKDQEIKSKKEMEDQIIKINLLEYRLQLKSDEMEMMTKENQFLINQRQEMEGDFNEKLSAQFQIITRLQEMLLDESKEIDKLQLIVDSLEMKAIELDEYRATNRFQSNEIEKLVKSIERIRIESSLVYQMKLAIKLEWLHNKDWYLRYIWAAFFPGLRKPTF